MILDVEATTGEAGGGQVVIARINAPMATTGMPIATLTADAGYACAKVYGELERRGIEALIPSRVEPPTMPYRCGGSGTMPGTTA